MNYITEYRKYKPHLLDIYKVNENNIGLITATYNVKKDIIVFYNAKTNELVKEELTKHIREVIGDSK